jgi:hypothetical protein
VLDVVANRPTGSEKIGSGYNAGPKNSIFLIIGLGRYDQEGKRGKQFNGFGHTSFFEKKAFLCLQ